VMGRSLEKGAVVAVSPTDTLLVAYGRMKMSDVSQVPVLEGDRIVGLLDESDLLLAATRDQAAFRKPVRDFMSTRLTTVLVSTSIEALMPTFDQGMVAIVVDGEHFLGLVTRIDVLNFLRRKL
jgi:cystathionine beta-synthase